MEKKEKQEKAVHNSEGKGVASVPKERNLQTFLASAELALQSVLILLHLYSICLVVHAFVMSIEYS